MEKRPLVMREERGMIDSLIDEIEAFLGEEGEFSRRREFRDVEGTGD